MPKAVKIILWIVAIVIVLLLINGVIEYYPYLKPLPVDHDELRRRMAEYQAFSEQIAARQKDDKEALLELLGEVEEFDRDDWLLLECSLDRNIDVNRFKSESLNYQKYDERLRKILEGGMIWQQPLDDDLPKNLILIWSLFCIQTTQVALDAEAGNYEAAMSRLIMLRLLLDGFERSANLMNVMIGNVCEAYLATTIVYLLPKMSIENLAILERLLAEAPGVSASNIPWMKRNNKQHLRHLEEWQRDIESRNVFKSLIPRIFIMLGGPDRIKLAWTYFNSEMIDCYQKWLKEGAKEKPTCGNDLAAEFQKNYPELYKAFDYDSNWDLFMEKTYVYDPINDCVRQAIIRELERRLTGDTALIELSCSVSFFIEMNQDHGCLQWEKQESDDDE